MLTESSSWHPDPGSRIPEPRGTCTMSDTARRLATWDDLSRTPDDGRVYEILDGELEATPRHAPAHNRAQALLSFEIAGPYDRGRGRPGGW